jgi:hypothetical protein
MSTAILVERAGNSPECLSGPSQANLFTETVHFPPYLLHHRKPVLGRVQPTSATDWRRGVLVFQCGTEYNDGGEAGDHV